MMRFNKIRYVVREIKEICDPETHMHKSSLKSPGPLYEGRGGGKEGARLVVPYGGKFLVFNAEVQSAPSGMSHAILASSSPAGDMSDQALEATIDLAFRVPNEAVICASAFAILGLRCMMRMLLGMNPRFFRIDVRCGPGNAPVAEVQFGLTPIASWLAVG